MKNLFTKYSWIFHLFALSSIAFAEPLFELLGKNPTFFTANNYAPIDIFALVGMLCVAVPLLLTIPGLIAKSISSKAHQRYLFFAMMLLVTVILMPLFKRVGILPAPVVVVFSIGFGGAFAWLYGRKEKVRSVVSALTFVIVVVPAMFLFFSPVSGIISSSEYKSPTPGSKLNASTPVVMLVLDEFALTTIMNETHEIDSVRFPNIAELARHANWYRNATTVADATERAVPSILTGMLPDTVGGNAPTLSNHPNNLFTLLGGTYDMKVMESVTSMCPPGLAGDLVPARNFRQRMLSLCTDAFVVYLHILLPREIAGDLPAIDRNWGGYGREYFSSILSLPIVRSIFATSGDTLLTANGFTPDRRAQFRRFINAMQNNAAPSLYFMHVLLPHFPWEYLPSGKRYVLNSTEINGLKEERWSNDEWAVRSAYQQYLLQAGFVDKMIGDLIARLKEADLYDPSLIVMCADHGVSFRAGDSRRPLTATNAPDIIPIPLIMKLPRQTAGSVSDRNVETIDILPTIANVLGVPLPWKADGVSLFDPSSPERNAKRVFGGSGTKSYHNFPPHYNDKYAALDRHLRLFGAGKNWNAHLPDGDDDALIGKSVSDLRVTPGEHFVRLSNEDAYEHVNPQLDYTLTNISGRISIKSGTVSDPLAVAVNGVIRAVTRTYGDGSGDFEAFVPEETFKEGRNRVEVFLVKNRAGAATLERPRGTIDYALVPQKGGGGVIMSSTGTEIPIMVNGIQGALDSLRVAGNRIIVLGWAIEYKDSTMPDQLLVFYHNRLVHAGAPRGLDRWDLIDDTTWITDPTKMSKGKKALLDCGFQFEILLAKEEEANLPDIRVFAVSPHGYATELALAYEPSSKPLEPDYAISRDNKKNILYLKNHRGNKITFKADEVEGYVDTVMALRDTVHIRGWAADIETHKYADEILLFYEDKNIAAFSTGILRLDLINGFHHDSLRNAGFNYHFPVSMIGDSSNVRALHVLAVIRGRNIASEISTSFTEKEAPRLPPVPVDHGTIKHRVGDVYYPVRHSSAEIVAIKTVKGGVFVVEPDKIDGNLDLFELSGDSLHIAGWAADTKHRSGVSTIVIFVNDADNYIFVPRSPRPDIQKAFGSDSLLNVGFDFKIPVSYLHGFPAPVRLFAIDKKNKISSELKYPDNFPYRQ